MNDIYQALEKFLKDDFYNHASTGLSYDYFGTDLFFRSSGFFYLSIYAPDISVSKAIDLINKIIYNNHEFFTYANYITLGGKE